MFLLFSFLLFAIQWLGSPWQLGAGKAILSCMLFMGIIILSLIPAMSREWRTYIKSILVCAALQFVFIFFNFILPGIGLVITIIYNIILIIISKKLPVSFTNNVKVGLLFFILWFIGINHLLGLFLLTDPRGVWSGDLYFSVTDWIILAVFTAALIRNFYHIKTNSVMLNLMEDDKSAGLQKREKKTLLPVLLASVLLITLSIFLKLPWEKQAIEDLNAAFTAYAANDLETASKCAGKYYNDSKILYNGDVFYLNGLIKEAGGSPQDAVSFYKKAVSWYKNHKSWVSDNNPSDARLRLANLSGEEDAGFFKRLWRNIKPNAM